MSPECRPNVARTRNKNHTAHTRSAFRKTLCRPPPIFSFGHVRAEVSKNFAFSFPIWILAEFGRFEISLNRKVAATLRASCRI